MASLTLLPPDEEQRLLCLPAYDYRSDIPDNSFDAIAILGADVFGAPICLVSLIGEDCQWLQGRAGMDISATPREVSFCTHTILSDQPLVVPDARLDQRFKDNPLVTGPEEVRFYAGAPLINQDGVRLGAFCILDRKARHDFTGADAKRLIGFAAIVSERLEKRRRSRAGRILNSFSQATGVALVTCNEAGKVTSWNKAAETLFGYASGEAIGRSLDLIIPNRFQAAHATGVARLSAGAAPTLDGKRVEVVARRSDGSEFPAELAMSVWHGPVGMEFGAQVHDISDRRARENQLQHLAHHDDLTGLLNRAGFRSCLDRASSEHASVALLALDLNGFKRVNDAFGHDAGDALLQMIAVRMIVAVEGGGMLARIGGDEFALLLAGCDDLFRVKSVAQSLQDAFAEGFFWNEHEVTVGVSIGIALAPLHASNIDELLVRADLAMFKAKKQVGQNWVLFDNAMASEQTARRTFKDELRKAYERGEWRLAYQLQVRLSDGALIGVEALLRWQHPERGLLSPAAFMPVLETHLVAYEVGCWVLDEACRQLAQWRDKGITVGRIGVNLFASQFRAGTLEAMVSNALMTHALSPRDLELEITETIALRHDDEALAPLQSLYDAGVGVSLDDFGTGFASLSTLQRFPLTRLKIDRSFVRNITTDSHSQVIVEHIAAIGRGLDLSVIAEGIETIEQEQKLLTIGCEEGQGFLYGKPMSGNTFAHMFSVPFARQA